MTQDRTRLLFLLSLAAAIAVFYAATMRNGEGWTEDSALYLQHAKNISTGAPYGTFQFVYEEGRWNVGPRAYPPVFPIILAAVYRWRGFDFGLMKLEITAFLLLALVLVFYGFRRELAFRDRLALVAILAFNPKFWDYKDTILSDIPFLFLVYAALFLLEWSWSEEGQQRSLLLRGFVPGLAMYLAYGTRTVGIVLIPAALIFSLLRTRRITKATWIAVGVASSLVVLQSLMIQDLSSYLSIARLNGTGSPIGKALFFLRFYVGSLALFWDNGHSKALRLAMSSLITALAAGGLLLQLRRRVRIFEIFAALYLPVLFVWEEDRYLFPLIPLYVVYLLGGIEWLGTRMERRFHIYLFAVVMAVVGISYAGKYSTLDLHAVSQQQTASPQAQQFFKFVGTQINDHDVIEFSAPRTLSLFTGRRASQYPPILNASDKDLRDYLRRVDAAYVTTTPFDYPFWTRFVTINRSCWAEVFSNSDFHLYQVAKTPGAGDQSCSTEGP